MTENAFRLGAAYYILKPFDTRVVVSRVRAGTNEKIWRPGGTAGH